ncbi:lysylphosphatidylglycerol synthase domain-containing protein [Halalkalicoccus jeotgali]|uniref:Dolichol-P-glucose synthetase n=1 Tax=Halalkalicoccus jeotgali (strain DSM 18796 / CECT 7217 / JCM 14584 / KCTC 4019 / B3) TaxID=795797 RepID=D8J901_HALJB|nr:lysylphosphatidylglycerol synthase domain-containing protein [Halalkalicoccus jeotgali]ADJ16270.1 dolichol-P-glucose synthetase [Halalkalicoccus jeotgali B3]ELY37004.1 dolichol-P-glucose synthetase [Halalkalicoccus jeotgali B3]
MSRTVSVVLPAYNEEATIEETVETTIRTLEGFLSAEDFEVIVAEDGCSDRTPEIASRLAEKDPRVRHFHGEQRLGRGGAVEQAFRVSEGEVLVFFDTDLATDMRHLEELVESVRTEGYDVATGSRWMPDRKADRPLKRGGASRVFNGLVRLALPSELRDHQCGFKAFDRETAFELFDAVEDDHWYWDTEVLVRAQNMGYRVKEFPVEWTSKGDSTVDFSRDVLDMGGGVGRMWWEYSVDPRITQRTTIAGGVVFTLLLIVFGAQFFDPAEVLARMSEADPLLIALSALVYVVSLPLMGVRYRDILAELGFHEKVGFLTGAIFISQTGNVVFPARLGDPIRAYVVKARRNVPYPSGFASLAIERVFDLLMVTALAGTVFLGLAATGATSVGGLYTDIVGSNVPGGGRATMIAAATVGLAAFGAIGMIVLSVRTDRNYVRAVGNRLGSGASAEFITEIAERFVGDIQLVAGNRRASARIAASSFAIWSIDVLAAILVLLAFGVEISPAALLSVGFFAVSVGNLAKVLPLSPGGIGMYEGAFTVLVVALTPIGASVALGAAIVDHAIKNGVTVLGGAGSMLALNVSLTTAVEESREAREVATESD